PHTYTYTLSLHDALPISSSGRHVGKASGGNDRSNGNHGIVAEVKKETGDNSAGPGARKCEDNADERQEANEAPGPAELRAVHKRSEEHTSELQSRFDLVC